MKRVLVTGLLAVMLTGLVGCGDKAQTEVQAAETTENTEAAETSDDTQEKEPAKSGVHFEEYIEEIDYDKTYTIQSYSEIPDSVKEEMKAYAEGEMKAYIEENSDCYENIGDFTYEGWAFEHQSYQSDPDTNYLYYIWSTTGTKNDPYTGEKTTGDLVFYGRLEHVIKVDEHSYTNGGEHGGYFPSLPKEYQMDHDQILTEGYLEVVDISISGMTAEAGDGFEKYGEYKAPESVAQIEKDPLFEHMKEQAVHNIDYYMDENFEDNISHTEPEFFGFYITKRDDINEYGEVGMIYKSVISDTDALIEDTEVLFNARFFGVRFTESGELMYGSSNREMGGHMELGDSAYIIRAYPDLETLGKFNLKEKDGSSILVDRTDSLKY